MMEKKIHYKMHKVKKNWVAIGVTTLALIVAPKVLGLEAGLVHADDVKQVAVQEPTAAQDSGSGQPVQVQANSASQLEAEKQLLRTKQLTELPQQVQQALKRQLKQQRQ